MNRNTHLGMLLSSIALVVGITTILVRPQSGVLTIQVAPAAQMGTAVVKFAQPQYTVAPGNSITVTLQVENAETCI